MGIGWPFFRLFGFFVWQCVTAITDLSIFNSRRRYARFLAIANIIPLSNISPLAKKVAPSWGGTPGESRGAKNILLCADQAPHGQLAGLFVRLFGFFVWLCVTAITDLSIFNSRRRYARFLAIANIIPLSNISPLAKKSLLRGMALQVRVEGLNYSPVRRSGSHGQLAGLFVRLFGFFVWQCVTAITDLSIFNSRRRYARFLAIANIIPLSNISPLAKKVAPSWGGTPGEREGAKLFCCAPIRLRMGNWLAFLFGYSDFLFGFALLQ